MDNLKDDDSSDEEGCEAGKLKWEHDMILGFLEIAKVKEKKLNSSSAKDASFWKEFRKALKTSKKIKATGKQCADKWKVRH